MCILLTFSRKRISGDGVLEIDCRFRKFDRGPLSEVLRQTVAMLTRPDKTNGQFPGYLMLRKLSRRKRESYNKMAINEPFVAINKKMVG